MSKTVLRRILLITSMGAIALVATGGPATAQPGAADTSVVSAALGDPWIKSGSKAGPVTIEAGMHEVASMGLPAGSYMVFAKAFFEFGFSFWETQCTLESGNIVRDRAKATIDDDQAQSISLQAPMTMAGRRGGRVVMRCEGPPAPGFVARSIKITAIRAGELTVVGL